MFLFSNDTRDRVKRMENVALVKYVLLSRVTFAAYVYLSFLYLILNIYLFIERYRHVHTYIS